MATAFPKVRTDKGRWAIIYTADGGGERPIHGAYWSGESDGWIVTQWASDGSRIGTTVQTELDIRSAVSQGKISETLIKKAVEGKVQEWPREQVRLFSQPEEPKV